MKQAPCGCCEGIEKSTPETVANRPGLDALAYRVGTHATFLETMLARLSNLYLEVPPEEGGTEKRRVYPLRDLTTRQADDPAIALLDAWATVADVLTFYQERIANEGYLRTAIERRSVLELARLVGYRLRPGVAASVYLAFTLEEDYQVEIPAGTRAQSLPGPGELPQPFETAEPLPARAEWNLLQPRLTRPQYISGANAATIERLYLQGVTTNLEPNAPLLLIFGSNPTPMQEQAVFRQVEAVEIQRAANRTLATLQELAFASTIQALVSASAPSAADVRGIAEKYLDPEPFDVAPDGPTAQDVIAALSTLHDSVTPDATPGETMAAIGEVLLPLRDLHKKAVDRNWTNLMRWTGDAVAELEEMEDALSISGADTTSNIVDFPRQPLGEEVAPVGLGDLIAPLLKPPSRQPANALRLKRTVAQVFAPQADTGPQLLATMKPALKQTLYAAWTNATVTPSAELDRVEALRVKAAPFGHNAPLKPIFDDEGLVVGHTEWPLSSATVQVRLQADSSLVEVFSEAEMQAFVSVTHGGETRSAQVALRDVVLQDEAVLSLEDLDATITIARHFEEGEPPIATEIAFTFKQLGREITLRSFHDLFVGVDGEARRIRPDQTRHLYEPTAQRSAKITMDDSGHTLTISGDAPDALPPDQWNLLALDTEYDQITPESWVVIERPGRPGPGTFRVREAKTVSKADYGITGRVTQLTLDRAWLDENDTSLSMLRETTVYAQGEALNLAEEPIETNVGGAEIELARLYDGLPSGRWVAISGERTDIPGTSGVMASELAMLAGVIQGVGKAEADVILISNAPNKSSPQDLPGDKTHTTLQLAKGLAYTYKRDTVKIYGNVVKATHGETQEEVLGSGDGSQALQTFPLRRSPLTHLAAPTPAGTASTLQVRVNDVLWHEADNAVGLGPNDRRYVTRTDNEDKTSIIFGNGQHGARLPTGVENITALYRSGIGAPGNVAAEQISLLATRPLGVKEVINPLRASGGADRESRDQARRNAPLAVMALDRLVSVRDYADFSRTFAGIGKAHATQLSDGRRELVHVTIAGAGDIPIDINSDLYRNLRQALYQFGDPFQPLQLSVRELMLLVVSARVRLLPDYQWESVEPQVRAALLERFSFERRELGQDVTLSELISVIQHVPGVAFVDVDLLDSVAEGVTPEELENLADTLQSADQPHQRVRVQLARPETQPTYHQMRPGDTLWALAQQYETTVETLVQLNQISNPNLIHAGATLLVRRERLIKPAQLAYLSPAVPDTLILAELTR